MKKKTIWIIVCTSIAMLSFGCASPSEPELVVPSGVPGPLPPVIGKVAPEILAGADGGTITVSGSGFTDDTIVLLEGVGVLNTTILNGRTATAEIPAGTAAGDYSIELSNDAGTVQWSGTIKITAESQTQAVAVAEDPTATITPTEPEQVPEEADPTATLVPPTATHTAVPEPDDTPTAELPLCQTLVSVNLRSGPGIIYEPPLRALTAAVNLTPLAFSPQGFPSGQWIEVIDSGSGIQGWVSANSQFVSCNIDVSSLATATNIPPTPTPIPPTPIPPTPTTEPTQVAVGPPNINNNGIGGADGGFNGLRFDNRYFLHAQVNAEDSTDDKNGEGIDRVEFFVSENDSGRVVYRQTENTAKFCIFQGGEPECKSWPSRDGVHTWGEGGEPVVYGLEYFVSVVAFTKDGDTYDWSGPFTVEP